MQFADEAQVLPGKIDKDVDFKPERPDEVFGLAEKTPRESLRIPTRIHSNRNDSALLLIDGFASLLQYIRAGAFSDPTLVLAAAAGELGDSGKRRLNVRLGRESADTEPDRATAESAERPVGGGGAVQPGAGQDAEVAFEPDPDFLAGKIADIERKDPDRFPRVRRSVDFHTGNLPQTIAE